MSIPIQTGLRWGFIAAAVSVVLFLIPYILSSAIIYAMWYGLLMMLLWLVFMVLAVRDARQQQGGYAEFIELVQTAFLVIAVIVLISNVFNYIFCNVIDTTHTNTLKLNVIENTQTMMQNFGAPEEEIEKAITRLEAQDFSMTPVNTLLNVAKGWVSGLLISLIIAAITRRKKPRPGA